MKEQKEHGFHSMEKKHKSELMVFITDIMTNGKVCSLSRSMWQGFAKDGMTWAKDVLKKQPDADGFVGVVNGKECYIFED